MRASRSSVTGNRGFVSFAALLVSLVVISILGYQLMKLYFKEPVQDKDVAEVMASQGIDTSSYRGVINSTRQMLDNITDQQDEAWKRLENIK